MPHVHKEMISFFVTTGCNLACRYCYTNKDGRGREGQILDLAFARVGIDDYFASGRRRHIRFFGPGEPTSQLALMQAIYEYAQDASEEKVTSEIQTNGVFGTRTAEWLGEKLDIIWVSCDGYPEIQDYFRVTPSGHGTSETVRKNVEYLCKNGKGMTGIRCTITDRTSSRQRELVDYFASMGVKCVWTDPVFPNVGGQSHDTRFDYMMYAAKFVEAREHARKAGLFYGSFLACNFDGDSEYNCRACIPAPHLTTDGYVSACDMALFGELGPGEKQMEPFVYGKWDGSARKIIYWQDRIDRLRSRSVRHMPHCGGCVVERHCAGYCLGEVTNESGDLFGAKDGVCEPIRFLWGKMGGSSEEYEWLHP